MLTSELSLRIVILVTRTDDTRRASVTHLSPGPTSFYKTFLWIFAPLFFVGCAVAQCGCDNSKDRAHSELRKQGRVRGEYDCLNVDDPKSDGGDISFCLAGRQLLICDVARCLTVTLDAPVSEKPESQTPSDPPRVGE